MLVEAGLVCRDDLSDVDKMFLESLSREEVESLIGIRDKTKKLPPGHIIPFKLI